MRKVGDLLRHILVSALTAALAAGPAAPALAGPTQIKGGNTPLGAVQQDPQNPNHWTINAPDGSIIHYSSFDIALDQAVNFVQPGADARVLNRIFSSAPTHIDGSLTGNGHIYIINPAGVVFGSGATVNAAGLQVVGGHLSDRDFERKVDHFTGLKGTVENAGQITANAVSLVGGKVVNSGSVISEGGWIVMAAGRDVLIGRDGDQRGVLLRVEGAANAVFNKNATGVQNTGTVSAAAADPNASGSISIGAGDLYGTAIFSNGAIEARKLALVAGNKGDIALGGTVKSDSLDVAFLGDKTGQMHGTGAAAATTIQANTVTMEAIGAKGDVRVGSGLAFRGLDDASKGPESVRVDQQHDLSTANLSGLDLGTDRSGVALSLSSAGSVTVTDKKLVDGTNLELGAGTTGVDLQGKDALSVQSLKIVATTTISDGDIVATGKNPAPPESDPNAATAAIDISGNLQFLTPKTKAGAPPPVTVVAAHEGTLRVGNDITTTNGGTLKLEAKDVELGTFDPTTGSAFGGTINVAGSVAPRVEIGFTDANGVQQTDKVTLNAIDASGRRLNFSDPLVAGGDVVVNANGDVTIHGAVNTSGEQSTTQSAPNKSGGSVQIESQNGILTVGTITTGGADAPTSQGDPERGAISLSAGQKIVLVGDSSTTTAKALDASGGTKGNDQGQRDRSITLTAPTVELDGDAVSIAGGDVSISGKLAKGEKPSADDPNTLVPRDVDVSITASGTTTLGGGTDGDLHSLSITSTRGKDVLFGGDVTAATSVDIGFLADGAATWGTTTPGGKVVVTANQVSVTSTNPTDPNAVNASAVLAPDLELKLVDVPDDPNTSDQNEFRAGSFGLIQDAAIDSATTDALFATDRFSGGIAGKSIDLESNRGAVTFDANARAAVDGTALKVVGETFSAPGADHPLNLESLDLTTQQGLDASFDVTATSQIKLSAGASGTGDLTVSSNLSAPSLWLVAGDGTGSENTARVSIDPGAQLRDADGTAAKQVKIEQDADLQTTDLPDLSVFGAGATPLDYQLFSRDGAVTLSPGADAKIAGTKLTLEGQTGVDLGSAVPTLASLTARSHGDLDVETNIATQTGGSIELDSGLDGTGDLTIGKTSGAQLDAARIDLSAGNNDAVDNKSKVVLGAGAHFGSSAQKPDHFSLTQDASIGSGGPTPIPDKSAFGDGSGIAGMELGLHSVQGTVTVSDPSQVEGTALTLFGGRGVTVSGDLDLLSLDATGATFHGSVKTSGDLVLGGVTTLDAGDPNTPVEQSLVSTGGALTAADKITKSNAGALTLEASAGALSVAGVTTAHDGSALTITGGTSVTTGALDASGSATAQTSGGSVTVSSGGAVDVASIDAQGAAGIAATKGVNKATSGHDGGAVHITGSQITVGDVTTTGGAGGVPLSGSGDTTAGGKGGGIELDATGTAGIALKGNLVASGGAGATSDPNAPGGPVNTSGDVTLTGSGPVTLLASTATGGAGNEIRGNQVEIDGAVGHGGADDPNAADTALTVVAEDSLALGGDLTAGRVDLELHNGNLALGPRQIHADSVRLAASDGAGGNTQAIVDLGGLSFTGSDGVSLVSGFTLEQDASITGSVIPDLSGVSATRSGPLALGLVSQDGDISISAGDLAKVNGTALRLAANGTAGSTEAPIVVDGPLTVASLDLGTTTGVRGSTVGGSARIKGDLSTGSDDPNRADDLVLTGLGDLEVDGNARVFGNARFAGTDDQTIHAVGGVLEIKGFDFSKAAGANKLSLVADQGIQLDGATQSLGNDVGQLEIGSALTKANDGLVLIGVSSDGKEPAVLVHGTNANGNALETANGDISVITSVAPSSSPSSTAAPAVGVIALDGGVLANGNVTLDGALQLQGGKSLYTVEARRTKADASGELTVGGIAGSDGDVLFAAPGRDPSLADPRPAAIHLSGSFTPDQVTHEASGDVEVDHALEFSPGSFPTGSASPEGGFVSSVGDGAVEIAGKTTIDKNSGVRFDSRIQGANDLDVKSRGFVELDDDVAMTAGALGLSGDQGVLFASTSDSQAIQAGSIALGAGAALPAKGKGSLVRDGDLRLTASAGGVTVNGGQTLIADGALDVVARDGVTLGNTAARSIAVRSDALDVIGGSTIQANSIVTSAAPRALGAGATFAAPTRNEVSSNVPSDQIIVRSLSTSEAPIQISLPEVAEGEFPDVTFPAVTGAALFDYSRQLPQFGPRKALARPHADPLALEAAVQSRPLWAEEMFAYLDRRSLETPGAAGPPEEAELLPPVGARPGETLAPTDARVRGAAVENAVALYRELFRPELHRDPETGVLERPSRAAEIRAAFQAPVDALRGQGPGRAVQGAAVAQLIAGDSRFASAREARDQLVALLSVGERALAPDQRPRFRALVLAQVVPYGIAPAEFDAVIR